MEVAATAENQVVRIKDHGILSSPGDSYPVILPHDRGCIDDHEKVRIPGARWGLAKECPDRVIGVAVVDPLEPFRAVIQEKEGWFFAVDRIYPFHQTLYSRVGLMIKEVPVNAVKVVPLPPLGDLASLKKEFFPG